MVILEKFKEQLEQLKAKIPFLNKGAPKSDDDADEDASEDKVVARSSGEPAWKAAVANQLPFLAKFLGGNKASGKAANEDATDANIKVPVANASEEKRKKIIRAVLVVGALYFVYDTLMVTEEKPPEVVEGTKPPKSKKALEREAAKAKAAAEAAAAAAAATGTTETPSATDPTASTETPPATDPTTPTEAPVDVATTPTDVIPEAPADIPETDASAPIEGTAGTITPDVDPQAAQDAATATTDLGIPQDDPFATGDVPAADGDASQPQQAPGMDTTTGTDQVTDGEKPADSGDMTEQILKDLEKQIGSDQAATTQPTSAAYINPPDYENVGRGLVYNCIGKHWACVDGPSFKICQQNNTALKNQNRSKECYPDSIYQSDSACGWVQKQKITGNAKTDFCN